MRRSSMLVDLIFNLMFLCLQITPDIDKEWYRSLNFVELFQNEEIAYEQIFPKLGWTDLFPRFVYGNDWCKNVKICSLYFF